MVCFTFGTICVSAGMSFWNVYQGRFDYSTWFLPYHIILPIDKSTMFEWYCEFFLQTLSGYEFVMTITTTVTFFGSCSYYIEACFQQFKHMFVTLDIKVRQEEKLGAIKKDLFEAIIFHNKMFDIFDTVADIYSTAIFFHLISNVLFFSAAVFQTEMVRIDNFCVATNK